MSSTNFIATEWDGETSMLPRTHAAFAGELANQCFAGVVSRASNSWHLAHRKLLVASGINALASLPDDWDGEGACTIAGEAISLANSILGILPDSLPLPEFAPNPNGTLSLYWNLPFGSAELEIGRTRYSWAIIGRDGKVASVCSGENRAFNYSLASMDLLAALTPPQSSFGTEPLTQVSMKRDWADFVTIL